MEMSDKLKAQLAGISGGDSVSGGRDASMQKVQAPLRDNQPIAAKIIGAEQCTRSDTTDGVMRCNLDHVALSTLTDYIKDLRAKNGGKPTEFITLTFEMGGGQHSRVMAIPTKKIEELAKALESAGTDKNYPVVLGIQIQGVHVLGDRGTQSGAVLLEADAVGRESASTITTMINRDIERMKKQQTPGVHRT